MAKKRKTVTRSRKTGNALGEKVKASEVTFARRGRSKGRYDHVLEAMKGMEVGEVYLVPVPDGDDREKFRARLSKAVHYVVSSGQVVQPEGTRFVVRAVEGEPRYGVCLEAKTS